MLMLVVESPVAFQRPHKDLSANRFFFFLYDRFRNNDIYSFSVLSIGREDGCVLYKEL